MNPDTTPITNAVKCDGNPPANRCQFCGAIELAKGIYNCRSYANLGFRSALCREREARQKAEDSLMKTQIEMQLEIDKAEAEVAKLNHQLIKTESDLLQSQDINSFLDTEFRIACKRAEKAEAEVAELWARFDKQMEAEAEVEKLRSILQNLTNAVTNRLSDDFQPQAARQLWEAFKVASETLNKR